jgi:SagB-type dehydrogenase family enzyme
MTPVNKKTTMKMEKFVEEELPLLVGMVTFNTYRISSPYAESVGIKTSEGCLRGTLFSRDRIQGETYLLNCRDAEESIVSNIGVNEYRDSSVIFSMAHRDLKEPSGEESIALPSAKRRFLAPLSGTILTRRSIREFSGKPIKLVDLSTVLYYGDGISGELPVRDIPLKSAVLGEHHAIKLRTAPSGGALYPIDIYVLAINVEELENGVYLYSPSHHCIKKVKSASKEELCSIIYSEEINFTKIGMMIVFVYNFLLNARKYGDSALQFALIEVGEISQNIHLTSTALGIGSCDMAAHYKHRLEKILEIDGLNAHVVHLIVIGNRV